MTCPADAIKQSIDARGLRCPMPVLKVQKAMRSLAPGDLLAIDTTDPVSPLDLAHFCTEHGHDLLTQEDRDDGSFHFVIRRGG